MVHFKVLERIKENARLISVTFNVFYLFPLDVSNLISNLFEERANADGDGVNKAIALPPRPYKNLGKKV